MPIDWSLLPVDCVEHVLSFCTRSGCTQLQQTTRSSIWEAELNARLSQIAIAGAALLRWSARAPIRIQHVSSNEIWKPVSTRFSMHYVVAPRHSGRSVWLQHRLMAWSEWYPAMFTSLNENEATLESLLDKLMSGGKFQVPVDANQPDLLDHLQPILNQCLPDQARALWIMDDVTVKPQTMAAIANRLRQHLPTCIRCDLVYIVTSVSDQSTSVSPTTITYRRALPAVMNASPKSVIWEVARQVSTHFPPQNPFEFHTLRHGGTRSSSWRICTEVAPFYRESSRADAALSWDNE